MWYCDEVYSPSDNKREFMDHISLENGSPMDEFNISADDLDSISDLEKDNYMCAKMTCDV